jgi:hypothetical protein
VPSPYGISNLSPEQRTARASIAGHTRWSKANDADRKANGEAGQKGLLAKFEREIREADPGASDAEVARRAESARKAHFARMAFNSSKARAARKAGGSDAALLHAPAGSDAGAA